MNRIDTLFQTKTSGILSLYFCAGHPAPGTAAQIIRDCQQRGVDMLEVGIPFSDPMADGPVIQDAATKALRGGMTLSRLFTELDGIRSGVTVPLILMGYLNPILHYGFERFCQACVRCGIDGVIIPDLPFDDYMDDYKPTADRYNLRVIMLITPETEEERIRQIDAHASGFIYMVSTAATTGAQREFGHAALDYFGRIAAMGLSHPRMIGFGISNPQTLQAALGHAAGAIIGSRFVTLLGQCATPGEAVDTLLGELEIKN